MYTIHNYSIDDNYTYSNTGTNTSHVITAMIHLAGRLCEHYASDIVYDANAFCERAKKYDLLLVPSDSFGCPGHVRISYCVEPERIKRALPLFKKLIDEYKGEK